MAGPPRFRFAPSPTGFFHVGSARTALYNWLAARRQRGTFILRIEDTDAERGREEWLEGILSAMWWLGLDWDEGPYRQSERAGRHRQAGEALYAGGRAYYCDCTPDAVGARRAANENRTPGYDGFCRDRGLGPGPGRALRFRTPDDGVTVVHDLVRGDVEFHNSALADPVILKSTGQALFLLANVVDDVDMEITHVVRGEDHLTNTATYLMLWEALGGGDQPVFAHLPLLVNEKRQKLSKRRDPVAVEDYRAQGYLPEAMRNFLALLGWAPVDGREILTLDELMVEFRLEDVNHSPAYFDVTKLRHFNGEYIRAMSEPAFVAACQPWLERGPWPPERYDPAVFERLAPLVKERVAILSEVPGMVDFVFLDDAPMDDAAWQKAVVRNEAAPAILAAVADGLAACEWNADAIRSVVEAAADKAGLKLAKAQAPVRVAITGRTVGPPLFESMEVLGRERAVDRVRSALDRVHASP